MKDIAEMDAQREYYEGNPSPLAKWLRSGFPLDQRTRNMLADILEGKFKKKRGAKRDTKSKQFLSLTLIRESYYNIDKHLEEDVRKELNWEEEDHWGKCEILARWFHSTPDIIDKIIYPRSARQC